MAVKIKTAIRLFLYEVILVIFPRDNSDARWAFCREVALSRIETRDNWTQFSWIGRLDMESHRES